MAKRWDSDAAEEFWCGRLCHLVIADEGLGKKQEEALNEKRKREERIASEKQEFVLRNESRLSAEGNVASRRARRHCDDLRFWMENRSWSYCDSCFSLTREKLLPNYDKRPPTKKVRKCVCAEKRYIVPSINKIPLVLQGLTYSDICVLRPLDFHCGDYKRQANGYRQKSGMCRVTWCSKSVREKINEIDDEDVKCRCRKAYEFLMNLSDSSYHVFVTKQSEHILDGGSINLYDHVETQGIECCLWPNLYPFTNWCESVLKGKESRLSIKIAFLIKAFSSIVDYSLQFELLQYHYDMWIFKTVSGAISSARQYKCSPARALNEKVFSSGYWKKQHRLLIDAVKQFGFPTVFVTISPYEWSFPFPRWLEKTRDITGRGPTQLAGFETIHIAHTLEQIIRGYLCGSNTNKWTNHMFNYDGIPDRCNIETYFYRFEFQERGTVHVHLLVWLKNLSKIQHELIRADIPYEDCETALLVRKLQVSDRGCLPMNNDQSNFADSNGPVKLFHPQEAFALNLRAYISSVVPALSCRMDFQFTDGKSMILRYVTSYVSKWKDAYSNDALYSTHVSPYQAAYRHLRDMQPCEPEMWLYLSSIKLSWSQSRTKEYIPPHSTGMARNNTHDKYQSRPKSMEAMSLLEWLRAVNHISSKPKLYNGGNTLVSVRMISPFSDEYFFQFLLMNQPHRSVRELYHFRHEDLPFNVRFFASAVLAFPSLWQDTAAMRTYFEKEGHREYYINTLCFHICSLNDILDLWRRQIFTSNIFSRGNDCLPVGEIKLDEHQTAIVQGIMNAVYARDNFYDGFQECYGDLSDDNVDAEEDDVLEEHVENEQQFLNVFECDWKKFTLVTGKPGTGKSAILKDIIKRCIEQERKILVASPTAILASTYRDIYHEGIISDTVHSVFNYPVKIDQQPCVNWNIGTFDVVVIDEVSMIAKKIFQHIIRTISEVTIRPIVLLAGDECQQQPIETIDGLTRAVDSILDDKEFYHLVYHHKLVKQYRCVDADYERFLDHIRYWQPSQALLDTIQKGQIICPDSEPTDQDIVRVILEHSDAKFLTVSKRASLRVNKAVVSAMFAEANPLAIVQCDNDSEAMAVYKNMSVIITQNRDKVNSFVNGQEAIVHSVENATIFLQLPNEKILSVYPVTSIRDNKLFTCYPFTACYSLTMCKSQGQNIKSLILWFDCRNVPPGTAYMSLSRIKRQRDLILITPILHEHCKPA